jgi:aryl-alcohol dehydrogenase-like predicted oxidoreductase
MKYRKLGNTGLIVSEVALGTMQFGGRMNMGNLGQEDTTRMVRFALDQGINFIDTADVYSLGESESMVGNALKGVRQEIVLATKVRLPMSENFNRSGTTSAPWYGARLPAVSFRANTTAPALLPQARYSRRPVPLCPSTKRWATASWKC